MKAMAVLNMNRIESFFIIAVFVISLCSMEWTICQGYNPAMLNKFPSQSYLISIDPYHAPVIYNSRTKSVALFANNPRGGGPSKSKSKPTGKKQSTSTNPRKLGPPNASLKANPTRLSRTKPDRSSQELQRQSDSLDEDAQSPSPLVSKQKNYAAKTIFGQNIIACRDFSIDTQKTFTFEGSYEDINIAPIFGLPEIAFIGRSNVGKVQYHRNWKKTNNIKLMFSLECL